MYRNVIEQLKEWKNSPQRKPLVLAEARQVGKTYIPLYAASTYFKYSE
jgi:hypothetical protein